LTLIPSLILEKLVQSLIGKQAVADC